MSTFVGTRVEAAAVAEPPIAEAQAQPDAQDEGKTRAELVEEAESLGLSVPAKATKAQIQKLIDGAPVM